MKVPYDELDEKCIPMVKFFNAIGMETKMCCEGHETEYVNGVEINLSKFWIQFSKAVTDEDIISFVSKIMPNLSYVPYAGQFCKIIYDCRSNKYRNNYICFDTIMRWRYIIDNSSNYMKNQENAIKDLTTFQKAFSQVKII